MSKLKGLFNKRIRFKKKLSKAQLKEKNKKLYYALTILKSILLIFLCTGIICVGAFFYYIIFYLEPSIDFNMDNFRLNHTTFVYYYDENGKPQVHEELYSRENRVWVNLSEIPKYMQNAAIAIEDQRFRSHRGVDWKRTIGAVLNLFTDDSYGGSTITQQLVKNLTGDEEVSITRKLQEILRALDLEEKYTKDEILEMYLNVAYFGRNCNGVQAAANTYFDKDVSELSLAESASIIGITQYPGKYDPFTHPDNNKKRQETILYEMYRQGMITEDEYQAAKAEKLEFKKDKAISEISSKQSYFTDQVIEDVIKALMEEKNYTKQFATTLVYSGGLKIYTTMNKEVQDAIDSVFQDEKNFPKTWGSKQTAQAAMVVIDPYSGAIVGLVGGRGQKTVDRGLNRATQTTRSPGSSIKPIAVYAPAIEYNVITEGSVYDDTPFDINEKWPKNYTNKYRGLTTIKYAVQDSINTIAVKVLNDLGTERSFNFMKDNLKITSLVNRKVKNGRVLSDVNLSPLGLGGLTNGISVLEITAAYAPFANKGIYVKPYTFTKVEDYQGNLIIENKPEKSLAMSEQTAYIMNDLLLNAVSNGTGSPAKLKNMPVAGKTGTTSDDKDRWFVGYTPYYVGGVWFGYDKPEEIKVSGNNPAVVLWKRVMEKIHQNKKSREFYSTQGLVRATVCADSGLLLSDACSLDPRGDRSYTAWFKKGTVPTKKCDVHVTAEIDVNTNMIASPLCPKENRKTVGLLNIKREFPYNLGITDAQYTFLPLPENFSFNYNSTDPVYQSLLSPGRYAGYSPGIDNPMNHLCKEHLLGSDYHNEDKNEDSSGSSEIITPQIGEDGLVIPTDDINSEEYEGNNSNNNQGGSNNKPNSASKPDKKPGSQDGDSIPVSN